MTRKSPKLNLAALVIVALACIAVAVPTAGARPDQQIQRSAAPVTGRFVPEGPDAGVYCGKDYSQNSATGDYCVRLKATSSSSSPTAANHDSSSWGDGRAGAVAAIALLIAVAGSTAVLRRRRATSPARRHRSPATT